MRTLTRLLVTALSITAGLALLTASASANRSLSFSPGGRIRSVSSGKMTFEEPGVIGIACNITLNGTFATSVAKAAGTHIGSMTEGTFRECVDTVFGTGATFAFLVEPNNPFDVVYNSFLGTLPAISGILFRSDAGFLFSTANGDACLYETGAAREAAFLFEVAARTGAVERGRFLESERVRLFRTLAGSCPASGEFRGSFTISPRQTVRLL